MKSKVFLSIISCISLLYSCEQENYGRIDQKANVGKPSPVEIVGVTPTSGGAVIKFTIPNDDLIKGVVASYVRNGEEVNARVSRYVDSLVVEGFADTEAHNVKIASFNVNGELSAERMVQVTPLTPVIQTVTTDIIESYGGVKIHVLGNESKSDLAVCLLRCTDLGDSTKAVKDIKWVEVTTLFTESNDIKLARRGIDSSRAIFGVYVRDRWGNISDTVKKVLAPWHEEKILKSKFSDAALLDDNHKGHNSYPIRGLWDDSGLSEPGRFFASDSDKAPIPGWITINLGQTVRISRIQTLPRIDYVIWQGAHPREFEFWGSMKPTGGPGSNEHGFDDSWFCLGKFEQFKPSGYNADGSVGVITVEDRTYFNNGNDFELDKDKYPHCNDNLRYLRIVFANTFATYELGATVGQVQLGEITPWGQNEELLIKEGKL